MFELKGEGGSIWRSLRQGSLGTILWALQRDRQVVLKFRRALESVDSPSQFAEALQPPAQAVANSVGQLALHQLAADAASNPHIEPRDGRWSLFRPLPEGVLKELCESIAHHPPFVDRARLALSSTVDLIKKSPGDQSEEAAGGEGISELQRDFLIYFGIGIGEAVAQHNQEFIRLIGEIAELNEGTESPLYPFSKPQKGGEHGGPGEGKL